MKQAIIKWYNFAIPVLLVKNIKDIQYTALASCESATVVMSALLSACDFKRTLFETISFYKVHNMRKAILETSRSSRSTYTACDVGEEMQLKVAVTIDETHTHTHSLCLLWLLWMNQLSHKACPLSVPQSAFLFFSIICDVSHNFIFGSEYSILMGFRWAKKSRATSRFSVCCCCCCCCYCLGRVTYHIWQVLFRFNRKGASILPFKVPSV